MSSTTSPNGVDPPSSDLVTRENSANSDSISSPDSESSFREAQSLRQLLPKPGMDMAEHIRRLSPINSEEDGEPDKPINPKDLRLSFHSVREVMKKALPPGTKIWLQAKKDMQRYASEFVSFITSEGLSNSPIQLHLYGFSRTDTSPPVAAENVSREHRRVIQGSDILVAMENTGFEHYARALRPYLVTLLDDEKRNGSPVSEAKDEDTEAAAVQDGETTESLPRDHPLGPDIPTAGDHQDTSVATSYSSFPWVTPSSLDPWVYPWVLPPENDDAE